MTPIDRLKRAVVAMKEDYSDGRMCHQPYLGLYEAAEAVIAAYSWQPIETAPKDQKSILGMNIRSKLLYVTYRDAIGSDIYIRHNEIEGRGWKPTHWMPLPEPPESE